MRTTVTLDDDVAIVLDRYRRERELTFKEAVNNALRLGLERLEEPRPHRAAFQTEEVDTGQALIPNVDDIADIVDLINEVD